MLLAYVATALIVTIYTFMSMEMKPLTSTGTPVLTGGDAEANAAPPLYRPRAAVAVMNEPVPDQFSQRNPDGSPGAANGVLAPPVTLQGPEPAPQEPARPQAALRGADTTSGEYLVSVATPEQKAAIELTGGFDLRGIAVRVLVASTAWAVDCMVRRWRRCQPWVL